MKQTVVRDSPRRACQKNGQPNKSTEQVGMANKLGRTESTWPKYAFTLIIKLNSAVQLAIIQLLVQQGMLHILPYEVMLS